MEEARRTLATPALLGSERADAHVIADNVPNV